MTKSKNNTKGKTKNAFVAWPFMGLKELRKPNYFQNFRQLLILFPLKIDFLRIQPIKRNV